MSSNQWELSIGTPSQQKTSDAAVPAPLAPAPSGKQKWANKTVLLVDSNRHSRESRAKIMRGMGVRVECAPTAEAANARLQAGTYNLVLVDLGGDVEAAESLVNGIRSANSRQLVGFPVGRPLFVATSLNANPRPRRVAPVAAVSAPPATPQTPVGSDFGQRIRDAEAQQRP